MEEWNGNYIMYQDLYLNQIENLLSNVVNPRLGILTYGSCQNFFANRLQIFLNLKNIPNSCYLPIQFDNKFVANIFATDVTSLALILSKTDTILLLDYYLKFESTLQIIIFGFTYRETHELHRQYWQLSIMSIPFVGNELTLKPNMTNIEELKVFFNQSYKNHFDYYQ